MANRCIFSEEYVEKELNFVDAIAEPEEDELRKEFVEDSDSEIEDEKDMSFAFKFPRYEELVSNTKEKGEIESISVKEDEVLNDKVSIFDGFHSEFYPKKDEIYSSIQNFIRKKMKFNKLGCSGSPDLLTEKSVVIVD